MTASSFLPRPTRLHLSVWRAPFGHLYPQYTSARTVSHLTQIPPTKHLQPIPDGTPLYLTTVAQVVVCEMSPDPIPRPGFVSQVMCFPRSYFLISSLNNKSCFLFLEMMRVSESNRAGNLRDSDSVLGGKRKRSKENEISPTPPAKRAIRKKEPVFE